jgi:hypothetical protein
MLGIGGIGELENLLPPAVVELLDTLALGARGASETTGERVGLVPFTVNEVDDGLEVAAAATETMRSILAAAGVPLAEPGCVASALRGPSGIRWGELAEETRVTLRQSCGAVRLVTGSVERWEIRGGVTPEPVVAVAVRLLDAATGRILFVGSLEAGGWDHEGWFGLGRVHSRGTHLRNLLERIATRMLRADAGAESAEVMKESS